MFLNPLGLCTVAMSHLFPYFREAAMALNSLYPDGWFALGAAALKVSSYSIFSNS